MHQDKVAVVVVTYNRKNLLMECLEAIYMQTYKFDKLILVDNASTDGTRQLLVKNGFFQKSSFQYILLPYNIGGAGGFFEGIKAANQLGVDWIWVMDDDTIPDSNCLEKLACAHSLVDGEYSFFASSVEGEGGEPMNVPKLDGRKSANGYSDAYKYLEYGIVKICDATFVSLLINNKAVSSCGLPCKSYFIWGDDIEYTMRLTKHYGNAYLIGESKVCHKRKGGNALSIKRENDVTRLNNFFYMHRNGLINIMLYEPWYITIKEIGYKFAYAISCLLCPYGMTKFKIVLKGIICALLEYRTFKKYICCQIRKDTISE